MSGSSSTIRMLKLICSRRLLGGSSNDPPVYHVAGLPMLDLHDPNVRVSLSLAGYVSIRISLGDLLPLLAIAKKHNYLWLQDFIDDEVTVTSDLYEILRAFGHYQKTPA